MESPRRQNDTDGMRWGRRQMRAHGGAMIVINFFITAAIFHVAAGRGCAKAVHAAIHVAAENKAHAAWAHATTHNNHNNK